MAENKHRGPTLDSFLEEEGVLAEFQAKAIKEVIAWQLSEAMRERRVIVKSGVCPSGSVPVRLIVHRYSILKPDVIHDQLQLVEPLDPLPAFLGGLEQFEHHR